MRKGTGPGFEITLRQNRRKKLESWVLVSLFIISMFGPACVMSVAWRWMSEQLANTLGWLALASIPVALVLWVVYARIRLSRTQTVLSLKSSQLSMTRRGKQLVRVDLSKPHSMLMVFKRAVDYKGPTKKWADVFVMQDGKRMSFSLLLVYAREDPGFTVPDLKCALVEPGFDIFYSRSRKHNSKQKTPFLSLDVVSEETLLALDSFSQQNRLLPLDDARAKSFINAFGEWWPE